MLLDEKQENILKSTKNSVESYSNEDFEIETLNAEYITLLQTLMVKATYQLDESSGKYIMNINIPDLVGGITINGKELLDIRFMNSASISSDKHLVLNSANDTENKFKLWLNPRDPYSKEPITKDKLEEFINKFIPLMVDEKPKRISFKEKLLMRNRKKCICRGGCKCQQ